MTKPNNYSLAAEPENLEELDEPEDAPCMLTAGHTAFHLPRSLMSPENGREYGFRTLRCGGVDDRAAYDLSVSQGWIPAKGSEVKEFKNAHHMNVFADEQDDLVRVQGQLVMYRSRQTKQYFDTQNETLLNAQRQTVARYRKASPEDWAGPEAHRGYGNF